MFRKPILLILLAAAGCSKPVDPVTPDLTTNLVGTYTATGANIGGTYQVLPTADASGKLVVRRLDPKSVGITFDLTYRGQRQQPELSYNLQEGQQGLITLHRTPGGPQVGKFTVGKSVDLNYTENNTPVVWLGVKQ